MISNSFVELVKAFLLVLMSSALCIDNFGDNNMFLFGCWLITAIMWFLEFCIELFIYIKEKRD